MADEAHVAHENPYVSCVRQQLEEIDLLSATYCAPGEMHITDPSVISDFNDFLQMPADQQIGAPQLKSILDFSIAMKRDTIGTGDQIEVRVQLPHLYPVLEHPVIVVHSSALNKHKERYIQEQLEQFIATVDKDQCYVFQVLTWLEELIAEMLMGHFVEEAAAKATNPSETVPFERLWIYSHHIKAKSKRQEVLRQARALQLSGFSRPGKPGIICVEGLRENTQEFWRIIKALHWQKINVCKTEAVPVAANKLDQKRRFDGFKEQLFVEAGDEEGPGEDAVMDMSMFVKYLDNHQSGYMRKELFGFD